MIYLLKEKIKTWKIDTAIARFAQENRLDISDLSFDLDSVVTYIKTIADDDFEIYTSDIHNYFTNHEKMVNEHVELKQMYHITIKDASEDIIKLKYDIKLSQSNAHPAIIIHPESQIPYKEYTPKEIYLLLLKELNKIKAKNKILVKIFDDKMKEKLKIFTKHLYKDKFVKKVKLPLFSGIEPTVTKNSKLVRYYLQKNTTSQVIEVDSGETLVKYIKPVFGKNGLNAFGKLIKNDILINKDDLQCNVDSKTIEIIENQHSKIYKSKTKGFIHIDENDFYIDNKIKMQHLSRVQTSVAKDETNNIEVTISQHDTSVDSLGEGVELTSETIHINGHVGAKSTIKAVTLNIDGATHKDSIQEAKFAEINRHKGKLRCHNAKIKLLEGGEVHATNVDIEASLGGSVYAENVTVGLVKSNLKVYASNSITIRHVHGEDNLFKINYKDIPILNSRYNFINKEIEDLKYTLEGAMKHTPTQVPILKEQITKLKVQQNEIVNTVKSAKITIEEPLRGLNTITFTIDDENELTFKTEAHIYKPFYLVETDNYITLHPTNKKIAKEEE
ncbi:MAG: hypothetical protein OQK48_09110 [Sulfurimonas sp.]|uniref:flagellar assembly protein A n=1 Tax=Sulfurimonas sp. TaxID=2022749 RepID=UPI002621C9E7|nr:flagellar assembly protein A [Sulfurimonas sp.]MCW8895974.1 hypothetical protein [Sulfurimonas sp.]MCW8955083.1 hypothetical protein [Sulfurimonas sp.]MCW9067017.1 hypothetical protein [Sulfurimonas sp.]